MARKGKRTMAKFTGPFLNGPALSTADICYIGYRTGVTTEVNKICKPDVTTTQMNDAFAGNYDPVGGFKARFPGYSARMDVLKSVDEYLASKAGGKRG